MWILAMLHFDLIYSSCKAILNVVVLPDMFAECVHFVYKMSGCTWNKRRHIWENCIGFIFKIFFHNRQVFDTKYILFFYNKFLMAHVITKYTYTLSFKYFFYWTLYFFYVTSTIFKSNKLWQYKHICQHIICQSLSLLYKNIELALCSLKLLLTSTVEN